MTKRKGKGKRTRGGDVIGDIDNFFKSSHVLSNVGDYVLPVAGGFLGSFLDPIIGPAGTAIGAAVGKSGNDLIRNAGYGPPNIQIGNMKNHGQGRGKKKTMKGGAYLATPSTLRIRGGGLVAVPYSMSH